MPFYLIWWIHTKKQAQKCLGNNSIAHIYLLLPISVYLLSHFVHFYLMIYAQHRSYIGPEPLINTKEFIRDQYFLGAVQNGLFKNCIYSKGCQWKYKINYYGSYSIPICYYFRTCHILAISHPKKKSTHIYFGIK